MSKFRRQMMATVTAVAVAFGAAVPAGAQDLGSSANEFVGQIESQLSEITSDLEGQALNSRNQVIETVENSFDAAVAAQMISAYDDMFSLVFPGAIAREAAEATRIAQEKAAEERAAREAEAAAERERQEAERQRQAAEEQARRQANNPCPPQARACVDIDGRQTWLQDNGNVTYGPVQMGPGKPGWETPRGTFYVNRQVKDEISWEFNNAPMPFATYFTYNGIAFHQGDPNILSHGCVRMWRADAEHYFYNLDIGDMVYVF